MLILAKRSHKGFLINNLNLAKAEQKPKPEDLGSVGSDKMDYLHDGDSGKGTLQIPTRAVREAVTNLNGIGSATTLLRNDRFAVLLAGEQKRRYRRWHIGGNFRDLLFGDYSPAAGHSRYQGQRRSAASDCEPGLIPRSDTTDLDTRPKCGLHIQNYLMDAHRITHRRFASR